MASTAYPELQSCMVAVARQVLAAEPNPALSTTHEKRWGARGSFSVDVKKGTWFSHETGEGGGVLDLLRKNMGMDTKGAWEWLEQNKHIDPKPTQPRASSAGNARIVATYDYLFPSGELMFQVCRFEPKDFRQRRPDPVKPGQWIWKTSGLQLPLYHLPEVLDAARTGAVVYITEGEKGADALRTLGVVATCSPGGAGKWRPHHSSYLAGADVVILPDNDEAGTSHAQKVARALKPVAKRLRILRLPDLPEKADPYDWVQAGANADDLVKLSEAAPPYGQKEPKPKAHDPTPATINGFPWTEDGIALAFAAAHQENLRYDHTRASWYVWSGRAWRRDETKVAFSWARALCRQIADQARANGKPKPSVSKASTASAVERFALSDPSLAVTSVIWDSDTYLLGTPDGTVDLRTGVLRDPDPQDFITRLTAVGPAAAPECPIWIEFLAQVTGNDAEMIRFLRQWCGYCLTGDTREQALVFAYGMGGNGKGVFLSTISKIMGDYCINSAMETFTASRDEKHSTELAMLRGARMVTASETEEGRAWAESRIKQLTGGDKITARFMHKDFFEFQPQFKLTMIGNHKPVLMNVDAAAKRRFNMVPFDFTPEKPDQTLEEKIKAEWPAILRWMIEGCLDWNKNGLKRPKSIIDATAEYFSEQDVVSQWMEERCDVGPLHAATSEQLFRDWKEYAASRGEPTRTARWFAEAITRNRKIRATKHAPGQNGKRGFAGIELKPLTLCSY
jgi:putative DNA primase/helicase